VPAAGSGARFGAALPKQYQPLAGTPVIVHSVRVLLDLDPVEKVWVIAAPGDREAAVALAPLLQAWPKRLAICAIGGATRRDTVLAGLEQVREAGAHWALVHDAARPLLRPSDALALIETCLHRGHGGILARPVVDTVKRVSQSPAQGATEATLDRDAAPRDPESDAPRGQSQAAAGSGPGLAARRVTPEGARVETIARDRLWLAQTPQMFEVALLLRALAQHPDVTDECAAIERIGAPVLLLEGSQANVKLTSPGDLQVLEAQLRDRLWLAQTPQMFEVALLLRALAQHPDVTDECAAIERIGAPVLLLEGSQGNVKLTSPGDLQVLEAQLSAVDSGDLGAGASAGAGAGASASAGAGSGTGAKTHARAGAPRADVAEPQIRIGQGYDVHALVPGRRLIIGGVAIDYPLGLLGHSDADVLLHAVTDAILGAAALGDIGTHFPDQDPKFRNADSGHLLRETVSIVRGLGWQIENLDCSVIAQAPRLAPYRAAIVERVAACLGVRQDRIVRGLGWQIENLDCSVIAQAPRLAPYRAAIVERVAACLGVRQDQVNLKAKTQEWLGFEGRGEGISAQAVVLLKRAAG